MNLKGTNHGSISCLDPIFFSLERMKRCRLTKLVFNLMMYLLV